MKKYDFSWILPAQKMYALYVFDGDSRSSRCNKIAILQNIFATVSKAPPFDLVYFASPSKTYRAYIFWAGKIHEKSYFFMLWTLFP